MKLGVKVNIYLLQLNNVCCVDVIGGVTNGGTSSFHKYLNYEQYKQFFGFSIASLCMSILFLLIVYVKQMRAKKLLTNKILFISEYLNELNYKIKLKKK